MSVITLKRKRIEKFSRGLRLQIGVAYVALVAGLLLLINIYPTVIMRRQLISVKENEMLTGAGVLANALAGFGALSADVVSTSLAVLDLSGNRDIVVMDNKSELVYDNRPAGQQAQASRLPEVTSALDGKDVFRCRYDETAFVSTVACPVVKGGEITGVVYFYERDTRNAALLRGMQRNMLNVSLGGAVVCAIVVAFVLGRMGGRFNTVLKGVREVGSGNYSYKINMDGADELAVIADEFNALSGRLHSTEELRRQFVSDASHELKTPLASIKLLSDSIIQTKDMSAKDIREFLLDIGEEIDRLTRITEGLLDLNKFDSLPEIELTKCDLLSTIRKAAELLRATAEKNKVRIDIDAAGDYYIVGSEDGLHQVIFNLIENAVKYNREGGRVRVSLARAGDGGEWALMRVKDTGIGIPRDELGRIFERFYRVDKARSRATGGTGLGLSIAREWVEKMGGRIEVSSVHQEGTEFRVYFKTAN